MKILKIAKLLTILLILNSCASGYQLINPNQLSYYSKSSNNNVKLEYKYNLLDKKYSKKEDKNGVRLVALKITNNSNQDLTFGKDLLLTDSQGGHISIYDTERTLKHLKQKPASYLWYLLLTPVNLYTYETNSYGGQETTSSTPIGLVLGPGLAGGNMIAASSANKKFETEMQEYDILNKVIRKGETVYGLVGIISNNYESLKLKID